MPGIQKSRTSSRSRPLVTITAVSVLLLTSCGGLPSSLFPSAATQSALLPTRTLAPQRTPLPTPTGRTTATPQPTATAEARATDEERATPDVASTPRTLSIVSCAVEKPQIAAASSQPPRANTGVGMIGLVTQDWNIAVSDETGRIQQITSNANVSDTDQLLRIHQHPTFSADGKSLAFLETTTFSGTEGITQTIQVATVGTSTRPIQLYTTSENNVPFLSWSPDNQWITFLTINDVDGATLRMVDLAGNTLAELNTGASVYWDWRNDSAALITHLNGSAARSANAHLAIADVAATRIDRLDTLPGSFRAPQFSPDGQFMLLATVTSEGDELVVADAAGKPLCGIAPVELGAAFAWSPDGRRVAWMDIPSDDLRPATLHVLDLQTGETTEMHDSAIAFFWSPDSQRLAVYSLVSGSEPVQLDTPVGAGGSGQNRPASQGQDSVLLRIEWVNVTDGRAIKVADTAPPREYVQVLAFFDQYSRAITPWSPDSQQMVFTTISRDRSSVDIGIATLNEDSGRIELRRLTAGLMAFWSPR